MKVKDVFKEIFVGINLSLGSKNGEMQEVYTFNKQNIIHNTILFNEFGYNKFKFREKYNHLPNTNLTKIKVPINIKEKYFLKFGDIVISTKKPYKVFNDIIIKNDRIIATNNFIILREMISEKYYYPYLMYYIEKVGIKKLLNESSKMNNELSLEDIKNIELPNIPRNQQFDDYFEVQALTRKILRAEERIEEIFKEK